MIKLQVRRNYVEPINIRNVRPYFGSQKKSASWKHAFLYITIVYIFRVWSWWRLTRTLVSLHSWHLHSIIPLLFSLIIINPGQVPHHHHFRTNGFKFIWFKRWEKVKQKANNHITSVCHPSSVCSFWVTSASIAETTGTYSVPPSSTTRKCGSTNWIRKKLLLTTNPSEKEGNYLTICRLNIQTSCVEQLKTF
jgi:hypothetical protein